MNKNRNLEMISLVAKGLGDLKDEVVFLGGAIIGFHINDPAAPEVRPTNDVDCVIELASMSKYYDLEKKLRRLGFKHPLIGDHPICRWEYNGVLVDIMPTDESILGFSNRWYKEGMTHAEVIKLPDGQSIKVFSVPYLIASKIEAFQSRGKGDLLVSADIEDVVAIIDGCKGVKEKILTAPNIIRSYLQEKFTDLLDNEEFIEAIHANIVSTSSEGNRAERAISILRELVAM